MYTLLCLLMNAGCDLTLLAAGRELQWSLVGFHLFRNFKATPHAEATVTIAVPSMGDSVTEGSVAAVLKSPGTFPHVVIALSRRLPSPAVMTSCVWQGQL